MPKDAAYIVLFYHDTHWDRVAIDTAEGAGFALSVQVPG